MRVPRQVDPVPNHLEGFANESIHLRETVDTELADAVDLVSQAREQHMIHKASFP